MKWSEILTKSRLRCTTTFGRWSDIRIGSPDACYFKFKLNMLQDNYRNYWLIIRGGIFSNAIFSWWNLFEIILVARLLVALW